MPEYPEYNSPTPPQYASGNHYPQHQQPGPANNQPATTQPPMFQPTPQVYVHQGNQSTSMSVTSLILGIVSIFMGCLIFLPVIGVILGFFGIGKEPNGRVMAIIGVILNGLVLLGWGTLILLFMVGAISGS